MALASRLPQISMHPTSRVSSSKRQAVMASANKPNVLLVGTTGK